MNGPELHIHNTTLIHYLGCSLSVFGLGIVVSIIWLFRKWREDLSYRILSNFCLSLMLLFLVYEIGIRTKWDFGCMVVATLLHYLMLSSFIWMFIETIQQYRFLVMVRVTSPQFLKIAKFFAWGVPLIFVTIFWFVHPELYKGNKGFCLPSGVNLTYGVIYPITGLLYLNFKTLGYIVYSVTCGRSKEKLKNNQEEMKDMIARSKAMICLTVLLVLSWVLGFSLVVVVVRPETRLLYLYLFITTISFQGFLYSISLIFRRQTGELCLSLVDQNSSSNSSQPIELKDIV